MTSRIAAILLLVGFAACAAPAAVESRLPPGAVLVDAIGDGRALATDGRAVYVVDGDAATVRAYRASEEDAVLRLDGVYGGRGGRGAGALFSPRGADAGTGLLLLVADEARGEVARFTTRGEQAAPLVVPDLDPTAGPRERTDPTAPRGRPVAVASRAGTVWVADAGRGHVLRFDDERLAAILGGPADGDAALARPTALALGRDGTLYVADGRRIQPFGPLGRPRTAIALDFEAASVAVAGDRLLVAGSADGDAILAFGPADGPLAASRLDLGEPLRGVVPWGERVLVLTPTRLVLL